MFGALLSVLAAAPAHAQDSPQARCERLVQRMAETARANLEALGETPDDDFVTRYTAQTRGAQNVCPTLPEEKLACLEAATDPLVAIGECAVNEGRPFSERLLPPMVASDLVRWQVHRQDAPNEAVTRAALRALAGTWEKTDGSGTKQLTITAEGEVTYTATRNGETTTRRGRADVRSAHRVRFELAGTTFDFGFHVFGDRVLFSNQTATGAYPIARGTTRVAQNGQFFLVEDLQRRPRCRGFGARLEEMPVRCGWEGEGETRRFVITRGAMRWIESGSAAGEYPIRFVEDRGALVADGDSMVWSRMP